MWQMLDHTNGKTGGYLRILRDGVRVADVFPYAQGADRAWVIEQANRIVETMNGIDIVRSVSADEQ